MAIRLTLGIFKKIGSKACIAIGACAVLLISACGGGGGSNPETTSTAIVRTTTVATTNTTNTSTSSATVTAAVNPERPMRAGGFVGNPALGLAIVGKEFTAKLGAGPVDKRNEITQLTVSNPTVGGASPSIDLVGNLKWTPSLTDFNSTTVLRLKISLKTGEPSIQDLPVSVRKEVIALSVQLGTDTATYSDADGNYLIEVTRKNSSVAIQGTLKVIEYYGNAGLSNWELIIEDSNDTLISRIISAPATKRPAKTKTLQTLATYPLIAIDTNQTEFKQFASEKIEGSLIDSGANVYSIRQQNAEGYKFKYENSDRAISSVAIKVLDFLSSCTDKPSCSQLANVRAPVVLIHGFSGGDNTVVNWDSILEGGSLDTWGQLPDLLIANGHPVFEMRWHTYMRFEEAAGALTKFTLAVAKQTGKKPIVIAHSFGGIVAHLALESEGVEYDGVWKNVPYQNQIARLITLNSPLSGINYPKAVLDRNDFDPNKISTIDGTTFKMTRGVDHTDGLIRTCYAITCLQAGALFPEVAGSTGYHLKLNAALLAGYGDEIKIKFNSIRTAHEFVSGASRTPWEGESIKRLQSNAAKITIPVLRFAGFQNLHESNYNYLDGDGLISIMGQAIFPDHFAWEPFNTNSDFGIRFVGNTVKFKLYNTGNTNSGTSNFTGVGAVLNNSGNANLDTDPDKRKAFSELEAGDCFEYKIQVFPYVICARSAHTGEDNYRPYSIFGKRLIGQDDFSIANYGSEDAGVRHPLATLADDVNWVKITPEPFGQSDPCRVFPAPLTCLQYVSTYKGKALYGAGSQLALQADSLARGLFLYMTLTNKNTGVSRNDFSAVITDINGQFELDVASPLANRFGNDAKLEDYRLTLSLKAFGFESYLTTIENIEAGTIDLGTITLKPLTAKVAIGGQVIDGQTVATGIAGVTVRFAQGRDLDSATIKQRADAVSAGNLPNARRVNADASGNFSIADLRAGEYSVLVTKTGYTDQLQGRVIVAANGRVSLSMLRILAAGESSITLRWAASGTNVASDLDSHFLRLATTGVVSSHIFYSQKTISGSNDSLDRDDTNYEGPETVTFDAASGLNFVYYVHNYSGQGSIPLSDARVTLRYGGSALTFTPPTASNSTSRFWRVFDIVGGAVRRCQSNCYYESAPAGLATQSLGQMLPELHRATLSALPSKQ